MLRPTDIALHLMRRRPDDPPLTPLGLLRLAQADDLDRLLNLLNHLRCEGGRLAQEAEYLYRQLGADQSALQITEP